VLTGHRRARRSAILAGGILVAAALVAPLTPASAAVTAPAVSAEIRALREAAASGDRVEVIDERTQTDQVFAEPDGHLTLEAGTVPQWVHRADGWHDVDLRLIPGPDGLLRPAASVADVAFSPGGTGPLAVLVRDGHRLTIGWPGGALPTPTINHDSATYADVLPGADLVVRATATGFSHVLVVRTKAAADLDAVRHLRFDLGGDAHVERLSDGSLQAIAGDTAVASAGAPAMWDSSGAPMSLRTASAAAGGSSVIAPSDAAKVAAVGTTVDRAGDLTLSPDPALLASASLTYPLYIDPAWDPARNRWAYATSNNSNNTDVSVARVGADPDSGKKYRSFFEFKISTVAKSHIESAYVQMGLNHSWSCTNTAVYLYQSGTIGATPRTAWSTKLIKRVADASAHAHKSSTGTCENDPQPNFDVNFRNAAITTLIDTLAKASTGAVTFALCACSDVKGANEADDHKWKKFAPGAAKLIIDYDHAPGTPTSLQVGLAGSGVGCGKSVGTLTPKLYASFPDADKGQTITGTWQWGAYAKATDAAPGGVKTLKTTSATAGTATWNADTLPTLTKNVTYGFRVQAKDPSPYDQTSAWTGWCKFTVDTSVPNVSVTMLSAPAGPGQAGSFRIDSTSADVTKFSYGFTDAVTKDVKPTARSGGGFTATVPATATDYGTNTLHVKAVDATLNEGNGQLTFDVAEPSGPVARWGLETTPSVSQAAALADQAPSAAGDTPLTTTGVTWADGVHLNGAQTAHFDGAKTQAVASGPVLNSTASFSVAAWVRTQDTTLTWQTILGKDAVAGQWGSFRLQLRGGPTPTWCILISRIATAADNAGVCLPASTRPGRWTHVAGTYDQPSGTRSGHHPAELGRADRGRARLQQRRRGRVVQGRDHRRAVVRPGAGTGGLQRAHPRRRRAAVGRPAGDVHAGTGG
jgi:hypothetical protein